MLNKKEHVKYILILALIICQSQSIKFTLSIAGLQRQCFYETLNEGQKYSMETIPRNEPKYEFQIEYSQRRAKEGIYYKMTQLGYERMKVYKLANKGGTYSFCFKNIQKQMLNLVVIFQSGVELLDFELLPDKSDAQNLELEISYLQNYKSGLYESISKIQQTHASNMNTSQLLSTKMIIFAVLGLISVVVVNYLFFAEVKKTFRERKLI